MDNTWPEKLRVIAGSDVLSITVANVPRDGALSSWHTTPPNFKECTYRMGSRNSHVSVELVYSGFSPSLKSNCESGPETMNIG